MEDYDLLGPRFYLGLQSSIFNSIRICSLSHELTAQWIGTIHLHFHSPRPVGGGQQWPYIRPLVHSPHA